MAELKTAPIADSTVVFVSGIGSAMDNNGALYRYNMANTATTDDTKYFNVIKSTQNTTGAWERLNVRMRDYPQGTLETNGARKTFWVRGTTNANGEVTVYATTDNTATGPAIFNQIIFHAVNSQTPAATPNDVVTGCVKTESADRKIIVYRFAKGGSTTVSLLGAIVAGLSTPATGTPVMIKIDGM